MTRGGRNGIGVEVANTLFKDTGIVFQDLRKTEGGYIATHKDGLQILKRATVTALTTHVINTWFVLK